MNNRTSFGYINIYQIVNKKKITCFRCIITCFKCIKSLFESLSKSKNYNHNMKPDYDIKPKRYHNMKPDYDIKPKRYHNMKPNYDIKLKRYYNQPYHQSNSLKYH